MPIHRVPYNSPGKNSGERVPNPNLLQQTGPCIRVKVDIPAALAEMLKTTESPIPPSQTGWALIDTGAGVSAVDGNVLRALTVAEMDMAKVVTANGTAIYPRYPARLSFPETPIPAREFGRIFGADLSGYREGPGPSIIALIGRDVLRDCVFVYNGREAFFSVEF
jgi:hypothetical protein